MCACMRRVDGTTQPNVSSGRDDDSWILLLTIGVDRDPFANDHYLQLWLLLLNICLCTKMIIVFVGGTAPVVYLFLIAVYCVQMAKGKLPKCALSHHYTFKCTTCDNNPYRFTHLPAYTRSISWATSSNEAMCDGVKTNWQNMMDLCPNECLVLSVWIDNRGKSIVWWMDFSLTNDVIQTQVNALCRAWHTHTDQQCAVCFPTILLFSFDCYCSTICMFHWSTVTTTAVTATDNVCFMICSKNHVFHLENIEITNAIICHETYQSRVSVYDAEYIAQMHT